MGPMGLLACLLITAATLGSGCRSARPTVLTEEDRQPYVAEGAQPGDTLRITFPGATSMNSAQAVQPNGTIALPLGGSLEVRGKTTAEIEKALLDLYGNQLVIKEVTVGLESAGFPVLVSGAVLKPGRVQSTRSMTVLEAIVEAGGFIEGRADMKHVAVVRLDKDGTTRTLVVNLKDALSGKSTEALFVRPSDVINVPERFSFY
ncbi:MAG: polysaccharide biosynthesis/export family protein [Limisphaerales bacterium]